MNRAQVVDLLTMAAAYDARTIGDADVVAWHAILHETDFADAKAALLGHFAESTERLMPAHIRRRVSALREERLRDIDILDLGSDVDPDNVPLYLATVRRRRDDIASGRVTHRQVMAEIEANYRAREITGGEAAA